MWLVFCRRQGDTELRAHTKSQVQVDYLIILHTFIFTRLSHLYKEYHMHCIVITSDVVMG